MLIIEDVAQKKGKHDYKHDYFRTHGISWIREPLPVGDYIIANDKVNNLLKRKADRGISLKKMDFFGTYNACVDTKFSMQEIVSDICGPQHGRFRDEAVLAQQSGIKLYVLIENDDGVESIEDVYRWVNPRLKITIPDKSRPPKGQSKNGKPVYYRVQKYPKATHGAQLAKSMITMQAKYGVEFCFCQPKSAGSEIIRLLTAIPAKEV